MGGIRKAEMLGYQLGLENSRRGCGGDVFRQSVPDASSDDWESSITNGGQSTISDEDK